jgi:hypothetical protein
MFEPPQKSDLLMYRFQQALTAGRLGERLQECGESRGFFFRKILADALSDEFKQDTILGAIAKSQPGLRVEVSRDGERIPWSDHSGSNFTTVETIRTALDEGLAVVVRRFEFDHEATACLAQALATRIGRPVFASLFVTYRRGATFPAHYDAANVFAVQLCGVKRWDLFEQVSPLPNCHAEVSPIQNLSEEPLRREDVAVGDLLYVPRGTIHRVGAISCPCVHISFGAHAGAAASRVD